MKEFRFTGTGSTGQPVRGTVFAPNKRAAEKKALTLASHHRFQLGKIDERALFKYKVRHPSGKIVNGEQKAFSQDEIQEALRKMGLEVLSVNKTLINYQSKPPTSDVIMFVRLAANLLKERLPFDEILNLLITDVSSKSLKQVLRDINSDLKAGVDARQAFMKHQTMLGKFTAYMLGIASQSGNMAEIYENTARFLERKDEFRKSVRSAMITPAITMFVLTGAFIFYIWYIFPKTAGLFEGFNIDLPPLTQKTLAFAHWMDTAWIWLLLGSIAVIGGMVSFARSPRGKMFIHKNLIKIPVIGSLLHKLNIEVFCRVFATLYSGSGENIEVMKIASEACGNSYIEHRVKSVTIPLMVAQGVDIVRAMETSGVFTPMAIARFRSGAETGNVRKSAQQMADYYEKETTFKLKAAIEAIQTFVAIIITIAITILTVISSEIALISPSSTDIMGF